MEKLKTLINNDYVYYSIIVLSGIIAINIISKFLENVVSLFRNSKLILYFLKIYIIKLINFIFKVVFFPITFYKWGKEYKNYNNLNINNSKDKSLWKYYNIFS